MAASAATQLDSRIPRRDNHTVVRDGENHTHTQIEGCSALGSKGGGSGLDRMHSSRRRHHSDVYSTYLLCSRRRCVEARSRSAWGRSADHSKESNSLSLTLVAASRAAIGIHRRYRGTAYRRPRSGKRISPTRGPSRRSALGSSESFAFFRLDATLISLIRFIANSSVLKLFDLQFSVAPCCAFLRCLTNHYAGLCAVRSLPTSNKDASRTPRVNALALEHV